MRNFIFLALLTMLTIPLLVGCSTVFGQIDEANTAGTTSHDSRASDTTASGLRYVDGLYVSQKTDLNDLIAFFESLSESQMAKIEREIFPIAEDPSLGAQEAEKHLMNAVTLLVDALKAPPERQHIYLQELDHNYPGVGRLAREFQPGLPTQSAVAEAAPPVPAQQAPPVEQRPSQPAAQDTSSRFISGAPQPNAYAFIIGIEEYRGVTPTPGARSDAEDFAAMLEQTLGVPRRNIRLLTDNNATRGDILATLAWMERNVSSDGRIYFFFSGHGSPNVETGQSYLLPYEGQPETLEFTAIPLQEILDGLARSDAQEVLAFVDACFSGSGDRSVLPEGVRPLVPVVENQVTSESRVALMASSGASEISGTTSEGSQGLFTHHLLRALGEGRADMDGDGMISLEELHSYLSPRVARDALRLNREQNPTLSVADELSNPASLMMLWGLPRD